MKYITLILIISFTFTSKSFASTINAGETYSFSFSNLYLVQEAEPNHLYDFVSFSYYHNITFGEPLSSQSHLVNIRLFEDNLPNSSPFYSTSFTHETNFGGIVGFNWPQDTWSDFNGLIEVEVVEGSIYLISTDVTIESNGFVYSSIQPVPLPGALWLFVSALTLLGLTSRLNRCAKNAQLGRA